MVSLLNDLLSYDHFHEKTDLIYRVITTRQHGQSPAKQYASASLRAGRRIKEMVPGIDRGAILDRLGDVVVFENRQRVTAAKFTNKVHFWTIFSKEFATSACLLLTEGFPNQIDSRHPKDGRIRAMMANIVQQISTHHLN